MAFVVSHVLLLATEKNNHFHSIMTNLTLATQAKWTSSGISSEYTTHMAGAAVGRCGTNPGLLTDHRRQACGEAAG